MKDCTMKQFKHTVFADRHIGVTSTEAEHMLRVIGAENMDEFVKQTIPQDILLKEDIQLPPAMSESEYAVHIQKLGKKNQCFTSLIGQGWYGTITPAVIQRNVLENPVWYTSYTPYQAEISQGRLEALMNFQTMVSDLTAMELSNCSLLDEATAAAEAVTMMMNMRSRKQIKEGGHTVLVDKHIFPEILAVMYTRAVPQGILLEVVDIAQTEFTDEHIGLIVQYPNSDGTVVNYSELTRRAHKADVQVAVIADLLALTLLTPPGEWGADIVVGSSQRMGIPRFFGGPSAAFLAAPLSAKRMVPGRIIGLSVDTHEKTCYRMALQTREQHIKRERATSNICTAQALLATMASFYAIYHGPDGLAAIAQGIHLTTMRLLAALKKVGYRPISEYVFDTVRLELPNFVKVNELQELALSKHINLRYFENGDVGFSIDEQVTEEIVQRLMTVFTHAAHHEWSLPIMNDEECPPCHPDLIRTTSYMTHEVFNLYHNETEMMRYIKRLERKDISLIHSMIPLGSCTMKLNAAQELLPISQLEWADIHPLAPQEQTQGYIEMLTDLRRRLAIIIGMDDVTLQPNSGASGEYTGLRMIREYLTSKGEGHRKYVLIPDSAHGTNPASAIQAGYEILHIKSDKNGNVDIADFDRLITEYGSNIAAFMITYPSTHGIFEVDIRYMCDAIHEVGAQVYMDGANMNGQAGLTSPGYIGADVCHLNLHKTFAIPHGGGGPGVGAVGAEEHLLPFMPTHTQWGNGGIQVASAPYGSAGVMSITYGYLCMMGADGLKRATQQALLSANYIAKALEDTYGIVYRGANGYVGHELILECRRVTETTGITVSDIAKRLIDYGYHAPTLSFPVSGTLMVEPTESESLVEIDRFILAMRGIWEEIYQVVSGEFPKEDNVLVNAPHPEYEAVANYWSHPYSREQAVYPNEEVRINKFWVNVSRIDNTLGDRHLVPTRYGRLEYK